MNPDVKAAWVLALRSGEFKQGHNTLAARVRDEVHYCCLGVLCELAVRAKQASKNTRLTDEAVNYGTKGDWSTVDLPDVVREWAGLVMRDPIVGGPVSALTTLSGLNDLYGFTFAQIAERIEEKL